MNPIPDASHIDHLLLEQGFVRQEDLDRAYGIRNENLKRAELEMGLILVKEEMLSKEDLNFLIRHPQTLVFMGALILEKGWMSPAHLKSWQESHKQPVHLKQMVEKGVLSQEQAAVLIRDAMDHISFLKLALKEKKISGKNLEDVLAMKRYTKSVSQILFNENLVSLSELNFVYRKCDGQLKLGSILIMQELLTEKDIEMALSEQKDENTSLGQILINKGLVTLSQLYFALSIQFNTSFRELKGFVFNGKQEVELRDIIGQTYAGRNQIIPLFLNENNLTLAVFNPSRIVKIHELMAEHSHLNMNCVLITREKFEQLYAMLYGEMIKSDQFGLTGEQGPLFDKDSTWIITDPQSQDWMIGNLYDCYAGMVGNSMEKGKELFFEFIRTNFDSICRDYGCQSVSFWFETESGSTAIKASPVLVDNGGHT